MSWEIFNTMDTAFASLGVPMYLVGILVISALFIGFLIMGLDFKYALAFITPAIIGFGNIGWFPIWIVTMTWIFIAGISLYLLYNLFSSG